MISLLIFFILIKSVSPSGDNTFNTHGTIINNEIEKYHSKSTYYQFICKISLDVKSTLNPSPTCIYSIFDGFDYEQIDYYLKKYAIGTKICVTVTRNILIDPREQYTCSECYDASFFIHFSIYMIPVITALIFFLVIKKHNSKINFDDNKNYQSINL